MFHTHAIKGSNLTSIKSLQYFNSAFVLHSIFTSGLLALLLYYHYTKHSDSIPVTKVQCISVKAAYSYIK